jgi:hypothetical protein
MQGEIIRNYPVLISPADILNRKRGEQVESDVEKYNVIILSQSSDLKQNKTDMVLICPTLPLNEFIEKNKEYFPTDLSNKKKRDQMEKVLDMLAGGHFIGACMLEECNLPELQTDPLVVDFKGVQSTPLTALKNFIERSGDKRIQLLPPYRERLSQSFARFFMRVGLPRDIATSKICDRMRSQNWRQE